MESLNYVPASAASGQHMIADGPYQITSYVPTKSITYARNPAWQASTDPIRKAYVDAVKITETGDPTAIQRCCRPIPQREAWSSTPSRRSLPCPA